MTKHIVENIKETEISLQKKITKVEENFLQQISNVAKQNKILEKKVGVLKDMIDILCSGA